MPSDFNVSDYIKKVFQMYDAKHETVQLKCTQDMMKVIIDRFDDDVPTKVVDENHFVATVEVALSPNFYGWLFGFGDKIRLIGPDNVVKEYRELLKKELDNINV
jgi:predicted nucleic acid-binding protein